MSGESIRVILRVRPLNSKEIARGSKCCVKFLDNKTVSVDTKPYNFDAVLPLSTTQLQAYEAIGMTIVDSVLNGYNGTIFAYGQTSSGKTHTMEGYAADQEQKGLIPRIVDDIFNRINNTEGSFKFVIKIAYMEIYMEKIKDCLDPKKDNLPIGETKDKVPFVKGITERYVSIPEEVIETLDYGRTNRTVAATNMNAVSSRSHSVFTMCVESEDLSNSRKKEGTIYLVDLAGSEKVAKTGAEGTTLDEAKMINKSLSTLGQVINALVEGHSHVPYRNSKLTRILQNSLGGNSKTTLVICCSPAEYNVEETKSTLFFGTRAKSIKNTVTVNEQLTAEEWKSRHDSLLNKYKTLRSSFDSLLEECKRWRKGDKVAANEWVKDIKDENIPILEPQTNPSPSKAALSKVQPNMSVDQETLDAFYKEMDLKDEELNLKSQELVTLRENVENMQKELEKLRTYKATNEDQVNKLKTDLDCSQNEVKEILNALEELAQNYDLKSTEVDRKQEELEKSVSQVSKLQMVIKEKNMQMDQLRQATEKQIKLLRDTLQALLEDLSEVGQAISKSIGVPQTLSDDSLETLMVSFRLYISKIKTESSSIQRRIDIAERAQVSSRNEFKELKEKHEKMEVSYKEMRSKLESTKLSYRDTCQAKRDADEKVAILSAEVTKLQTTMDMMRNPLRDASAWKNIQSKLDESCEMYIQEAKEFHCKLDQLEQQMTTTNAELAAVEAKCLRLHEQKLAVEVRVRELEEKLCALDKLAERRDDAKKEFKGLEENVIRELQTLHNLRKMFVSDLKIRIQKTSLRQSIVSKLEESEQSEEKKGPEESSGNLILRERIAFLEMNLGNITGMHKHLVRENSELRGEVPKLEKRLKATLERVKQLENSLKDTKDNALRDRKRYQMEVEKIKEQVRNRMLRPMATNIIKPIRTGALNTDT